MTPRPVDGEAASGAASPPSDAKDGVLVIREGTGANCSSLGSLVTTLVLGTAAAGVLMSAVLAALEREQLEKIHRPTETSDPPDDGERSSEERSS